MMREVGLALLVLTAIGGYLALLGWVARQCRWGAEISRKWAHAGLGLGTLSFPFLFTSHRVVWFLAVVATLVMLVIRLRVGPAKRLAHVVHAVQRRSWGELCFPLVVALTFTLADGRALYFSIPILVLSLADAAGALIGLRYGANSYSTEEGRKTVEGSVAVGLVAFFCVHVPLLVWAPGIGRVETLGIAFVIALLVVAVEGIAFRGLDNLYLPILVLVLLVELENAGIGEIGARCFMLSLCVVLGLLVQRRSLLNGSATLAISVLLYLFWAVGGVPWLIAPLAALLVYVLLAREPGEGVVRRHGLAGIFAVGGPGVLWLALGIRLEWSTAWGAFVTAHAVAAGLLCVGFLCERGKSPQWWRYFLWSGALALLVSAASVQFLVAWEFGLWSWHPQSVFYVLRNALVAGLLAVVFARLTVLRDGTLAFDDRRWALQAGLALIGSMTGIWY